MTYNFDPMRGFSTDAQAQAQTQIAQAVNALNDYALKLDARVKALEEVKSKPK